MTNPRENKPKSKKYGNDRFWCFIPNEWNGKEVAIWKGPEGQEKIIARAEDKYEARAIVDALIVYVNTEYTEGLTEKELAFLEFVCANCVEPYATVASNAILWKDKTAFEELKTKFPSIYP